MSAKPTLDEFFPLLHDVTNAPQQMCEDAYNFLDTHWRGDEMTYLYEVAYRAKSTRAILETLWPGMQMQIEKQKPEYFKIFMYGLECMVRKSTETIT